MRPSQNGAWTHLVLFFGIDASSLPSHTGALVSRLGPAAQLVVAIVIGAMLSGGALAPDARAVTAPDRSSVVLVLDFSASILQDAANRARFGAALERIAARVDETSSDLVAGDATVTIVQFAATAVDYPGCTDLKLLGDPQAVVRFADCLRSVANAYRTGLDPALTAKIGIDTNYVAAMEQAAKHLPPDAVRPTLILFTDGKHDVKGVPVSQVQVVRDRLFGTRSPIALLPVGMGLQASERAALEAGLLRMRVIKDMPACISGAVFDWPQVVFQTADEAGNAVAVALQDATCTFTVAPVASPTPVPTPLVTIGAVQGIRLTPGDGRIEVAWGAPPASSVPVVDYRTHCRADDGTVIESTEGVSLDRAAVVEGLTDGTAYTCEVAVVGPGSSLGPWVAASATATPLGKPAAPGKPSVLALNEALQIAVAPGDAAQVSGFNYECSGDDGATWPSHTDAASAQDTTAQIGNLTNGMAYICRAFALNDIGRSDASPISDAVRPCGTTLECNPVLVPVLGVLGIVLVGGLIMALVALARIRRRGYVIVVVDVVHTANLGYGHKLGFGFVRDPASGRVTSLVADRSPKAEIRVHHRGGGRFIVTDRRGRHEATDGEAFVAVDSVGARHELILRAFNTKAASAEPT